MAYDANTSPSDIYMGPSSEESPGGFVFGPQGWLWGQQRAKGITYFLDGTAKVTDQHGRPIRGATVGAENKVVLFAQGPPSPEDMPGSRDKYLRHAQVIEVLEAEKVDWQALVSAGFPQLPYEKLKTLKVIPPTPIRELKKIRDLELRRAALKIRREVDEARHKELQEVEEE